jgi:hypothetical protein
MVMDRYSRDVEDGPARDMDGSVYAPDLNAILRQVSKETGYTIEAIDAELYKLCVKETVKDEFIIVDRKDATPTCPCGSERMPVSIDGQLVCEDCIDEMAVLVS